MYIHFNWRKELKRINLDINCIRLCPDHPKIEDNISH